MIRRRPPEMDTEDDCGEKAGRSHGSPNDGSGHQERLALLKMADISPHDAELGVDGESYENSQGEDTTSGSSVVEYLDDEEECKASHGRRLCWFVRVVLMLSVLCAAAVAVSWWLLVPPTSKSDRSALTGLDGGARKNHGLPVDFRCPADRSQNAINADEDSFEQDYGIASRQITTNVTEFLETFRQSEFDAWGRPYQVVKAGLEEFKATYYPPYLRNGSSIYESACGIGLNLYMTLEIMRDYANLTNLFVYGNEYVPASAEKANWVLDRVAPADGRKGVICAGDSSNLSHVPSNAFDLVYTGYVTPILDPLDLHPDEEYTDYNQICDALNGEDDSKDWMGQKLNEIIQQRQEDWYGRWVGEMARIAKPGVPVIVEQVSPPYCSATNDWGGVDRDFWEKHARANTYNWNVDPESIEIVAAKIFTARYNVFMLKNA